MSTRKTEHSIAADTSSQALRRKAEEKASRDESSAVESLSLDDARRMLHELQVHQIELQMQNEELRSTQHELEASRDSYFDLYDLAPVGYLTLSEQGLILQANLAAAAMFGGTQRDLHKKPISSFFLREDQDIYNLHRNKVFEADELQSWEMSMLRTDGSLFWAKLRATPAHNGEYRITVIDITGHKQAEGKLQKKNAEMEQFIYTVSHDLRSPLVTVKTFMGYLEKDMAEGNQKQLAQDIGFIHAAADKMKLLLDELLEMSRIGRVETPPVKVSFKEMLVEVLDALAGAIKERAVDIHLPDTDLMLFGERLRLCQIWQNLIENAIKYGRNDSAPRIEIGVQQEIGGTVFFVKDNGIGIAPQYHSKIFGIFDKLDPKSPGAGLGLSMVQRIVEKCGGRIWVESEGISQGACFFFTLPRALYRE